MVADEHLFFCRQKVCVVDIFVRRIAWKDDGIHIEKASRLQGEKLRGSPIFRFARELHLQTFARNEFQ